MPMSYLLRDDLKDNHTFLDKALADISTIITILDISGKVIFVNKVVNGIDIKKFIGSSIYDHFPCNTTQKVKSCIQEVCATNQKVDFEDVFIDCKDRKHFYNHSFTPIFTDNILTGVTIVSTEITKLKRLETELLRAQDISALTLDSLSIGIWDYDLLSGVITWDDMTYNILGWTRDAFDKSFETFLTKIIHPDDQEAFELGNVYARKNGVEEIRELRFIHGKEGRERWLRIKSKHFRNDDGVVVRLCGICWDATEIIEQEGAKKESLELLRQNDELKEFAYLASHDLKAPLRTLRSFSDLLSRQYEGQLDEKATKYLKFISEAAEEMDTQIKELLTYSLVGQHKDKELVDCNLVVNKIISKLSFAIETSGCEVVVEQLPSVVAHVTDISLLFQNLISNAIKFHNPDRKPTVNISAKAIGETWQFEIKDNGIGIEEKHQKKIFTIFERLHSKEEFEGTGIGLAHCRKIVELHKGKIWVKSIFGVGSTFLFTIGREQRKP